MDILDAIPIVTRDPERTNVSSSDQVRRHCVQYRRMEGNSSTSSSSSSMRHNRVVHRNNGESSTDGSITPSLTLSNSSSASNLSALATATFTSANATAATHKVSQSSSTTIYSAASTGRKSITNRSKRGFNISTESDTMESSLTSLQLNTSHRRHPSLENKLVDQILRFRNLTEKSVNRATSPSGFMQQTDVSENKIQVLEDQSKALEEFQQLLMEECESGDDGSSFDDIYGLMQREGLPASYLLGLINPRVCTPPPSSNSTDIEIKGDNDWSPIIKPTNTISSFCPPPMDDEPFENYHQKSEISAVSISLEHQQPIECRYETANRRLELNSARVFRKIVTSMDLDKAMDESHSSNGSPSNLVIGRVYSTDSPTNESTPHWKSVVELVVDKSRSIKEDKDLNREFIAIIENFTKRNESICQSVIDSGGLDSVLFSCRSEDQDTLRHAVLALANFSLYGGKPGQMEMVRVHAVDWLLPLAVSTDDVLQYYAFLTLVILLCNRELNSTVTNLELLKIIIPFVQSHNPEEFAREKLAFNPIIFSQHWLCRLTTALLSERPEMQAFAAFHFAAAASLKPSVISVDRAADIPDWKVVEHALGKVAEMAVDPAYKLAGQALRLLGKPVPKPLSLQVCLWTVDDVACWISRIGFDSLTGIVSELRIDGDLLLTLTESELQNDLGITNSLTRRRFLRELTHLKATADYSSIDPTDVSKVLSSASEGIESTVACNVSDSQSSMHQSLSSSASLLQYAYSILSAGICRHALTLLTDADLKETCGITSPFHRRRLLDSARALAAHLPCVEKISVSSYPLLTAGASDQNANNGRIDAFISYRRSNGSQLASLLKVHLQLRGYRVFLDIERLTGGRFDKKIFDSIRSANNFILVLTPNALDRCKGDRNRNDWVHKEIFCAVESKCNIIPLTDRFTWPSGNEMPDDIRCICEYNGVDWSHDYQDACIDKLVKFMNKHSHVSRKLSSLSLSI